MENEIKEETTSVETLDDAALDAQLNEAEEGETQQEETTEGVAEEVKEEEAKPAEEAKEEDAEPEETEEQKKDRIIKQQEEFIQRRNSEIGAMRQQLNAALLELQKFNPEENNEQYYTDPTAAVNAVLEQRVKEMEAQTLAQQVTVKQNELVVKSRMPDIDNMLDDIANFALADGAAPETIQHFKANPYAAQPDLLIQLAARVKVEKENKELKAQIEALRKKPDEALKKVEQAARQAVTGATGKSSGEPIAEKQITKMSLAELEAALNEPD